MPHLKIRVAMLAPMAPCACPSAKLYRKRSDTRKNWRRWQKRKRIGSSTAQYAASTARIGTMARTVSLARGVTCGSIASATVSLQSRQKKMDFTLYVAPASGRKPKRTNPRFHRSSWARRKVQRCRLPDRTTHPQNQRRFPIILLGS